MRKLTLIFIFVLLNISFLFSAPVDTATAKQVAINFWKQNNYIGLKNGQMIRVQREVPDFVYEPLDTSFTGLYVFKSTDNNGYIIVAAETSVLPILGYSNDATFDASNMPPALRDWLLGYELEIRSARQERYVVSEEVQRDWETLLAGQKLPVRNTTNVAPLLTTNWGQGLPYNLLCPYDYDANTYTATGCVATAMAQVMKYWEYPQVGIGSHTYEDSNYGIQSANFESVFAWNEMFDSYSTSSSYTAMQLSAISTLMKMCGVSVDMNYGTELQGGSSAITTAAALLSLTPLAPTFPSAENALKIFFDYSPNLIGIAKSNYSNSQWISILKNELDNNRVVLYSGSGSGGGHAFVCDGYNNNNYFHFNWGWNGGSNGYFSVTSLTPSSFNFSQTQQAVIGITPANQTTHPNYDLVMYSTLTTSDTSYVFGSSNSVTVNCAVANTGNASFNGYLTAMVSDLDGNVVSEIPVYASISPNHYINQTFTIPGGLPLGPGRYFVVITSSTNTNDPTSFQIVRDNVSNMNFAQFRVTHEADIETYSEFDLSEDILYSGQSVTVNVDIANYGSSFSGDFAVVLLSLTGSVVQIIQQHTLTSPLESMTHYTNGLNFSGIITAPQGDYFLTLIYKVQGYSYWNYAGSYFYQNPIRITVHAQPVADIYEANNTAATAYALSPVFTDDIAEVNTNGANFHSANDEDYYKIILPSGYSYDIVPVLQDIYYNDDISYSVDAKFYFSVNNTTSWQGPYDYDANILTYIENYCGTTMSDGGTIYLKVNPTGQGDIGTYSLHVFVNRSINPDQYEPNNTSATAYNLGTMNTSSANYNVDANFHITTDNDYYKINLPAGYSYTINANILNSYNNTFYTADAKFATSQDGSTWSSNYGNAMSAMTMSNGGTLYFRVLPYTNNEIGTYKLQISITQSGGVQPDMYETNNSASTAYNLGTVSTNTASYTVNANFHVTTDNDYYKINLPSGYSYTINANILNSGNDSSYTANAHFATSLMGSLWSSNYNNSMSELTISDGGTLYFRVLPVTSGEIGTYSLHISVTRTIVVEPDMYEPNNTASTAYNLGTMNTNSTSYTVNANFHVSTDNDYYKINLPLGYSYTINANILNSYNNSNYSADAKFATSQNGTNWSSNYGSTMPALTITDGGVLYFRVLPYTDHEIGTYQLQINISRNDLMDPDIYEPNNTVSTAYLLATVNEIETTIDADASFHLSSDVDYYQINLPPDYTYYVAATLFERTNDPTFTGDAKIAVSTDYGNTWSSYYNSNIPTMTFEHSGRPYYRVVPQQEGSTGTYRLHISVSRATGIADFDERISIYPNPTNGIAMLQMPDSWQLNQMDVLSPSGDLVKSLSGDMRSFDVSELSRGLYLLRLDTSNGIIYHKLIKQ